MVGSCPGPLLFSIFTNDLPYAVENAIVMYADDSTLYYAANTNNELNDVVSQELDIVHEWILTNKPVLTTSKNKKIVLGSRHRLAAGQRAH